MMKLWQGLAVYYHSNVSYPSGIGNNMAFIFRVKWCSPSWTLNPWTFITLLVRNLSKKRKQIDSYVRISDIIATFKVAALK